MSLSSATSVNFGNQTSTIHGTVFHDRDADGIRDAGEEALDGVSMRIYRFEDGHVEVWLDDAEINRANGLLALGDELLIGNTGDGSLKAVNLDTKHVRKVATLGAGVVDGIRTDAQGNYPVAMPGISTAF